MARKRRQSSPSSPPSSSSSSKSNTPEKKKKTTNHPTKITSDSASIEEKYQSLEQCILHFLQCCQKNKGTTRKNITIQSDDDRSKLSSDVLFRGAIELSFLTREDGAGSSNTFSKTSFSSCVSTLSSFLLDEDDHHVSTTNSTSASSPTTKYTSISKKHVANLVLPWVVDSLLVTSKGENRDIEVNGSQITVKVLWKTLALCLEILLLGEAIGFECIHDNVTGGLDEAMIGMINKIQDNKTKNKSQTKNQHSSDTSSGKDGLISVLTQGTLNKLVPYAIEHSLQRVSKEECSFQEQIHAKAFATRCGCLLMMSSYYRPTMDIMCKTIIPLMDDLINPKGDEITNEQKFQEIVVSFATLSQLNSLQQVGRATNPKKNFIALSSTNILCALMKLGHTSRTYNISTLSDESVQKLEELSHINSSLLKEILFNGLFNLEHHIEGFCALRYSLPKADDVNKETSMDIDEKEIPKSHSCYQDKMFDSIQSIYKISNNLETNEFDQNNLDLTPILIDAFMQQSSKYSENLRNMSYSSKKSSSLASVDKLASTQFRFWSSTFNPLLVLLQSIQNNMDSNLCVSKVIESINKSLELLVANDSYLPSYNDPNNEHLNYLTTVGEVILNVMERRVKESRQVPLCPKFYKTLEILLNLNHHIFHRKLMRIFWLVAQIVSVSADSECACSLVSSIYSVYQKLRQLSHMLRAILCHFEMQILDDNFDPPKKLQSGATHIDYYLLFHDNNLVQSLSNTISSVPSGQIQEIWQIFDKSLLLMAREERKIEKTAEFFVIFLRAIQITQFNAQVIMTFCENTMKSAISKLIGIEELNDSASTFDLSCPLTNTGLYLCGWIVHVYNNCCFWMTDIPNDNFSLSTPRGQDICGVTMAPLLLNTIRSELEVKDVIKEDKRNKLFSLQHLASHRIEQLHSSIHLQQQHEQIDTASEVQTECASSSMIAEAKTLVDFLIFSAQYRSLENSSLSVGSKTAGWKIIARTIAYWIPYSEVKHVDFFLHWLIFTLSVKEKSSDSTVSFILNPGTKDKVSTTLYKEERTAAIALLHDTSFFEVAQINERFPLVALRCTIRLLQLDHYITTKTLQSDNLTTEMFRQVLAVKIRCSPSKDKGFLLDESLRIVQIVYKLLRSLRMKSHCHTILDQLIVLQVFIDKIILYECENGSKGMVASLVKMTCILRRFLAFMLTQFQIIDIVKKNDLIAHLQKSLHEDVLTKIAKDQRELMLSSTSDVMKSLILSSLKTSEESKPLMSLLSMTLNSSNAFEGKISLLGPIIRHINTTNELSVFGNESGEFEVTMGYMDSFNELSTSLLKEIKQTIAKAGAGMTQKEMDGNTIDFVTDALKLSFSQKKDRVDETLDLRWFVNAIYDSFIKSLSSDFDKLSDCSLVKSFSYFLCFISHPNMKHFNNLTREKVSFDIQAIIISMVKSKGSANPLIDSAYATHISFCTPQEITRLLDLLLQSCSDDFFQIDSVQAILYCFQIMMKVMKDKDNITMISSKSPHFLQIALWSMTMKSKQRHQHWSNGIKIALSTLTSVIYKNDLIILKGSHVANILSGISSIYHQLDKLPVDHVLAQDIFSLSCEVLNALLRQYSKHLYGCAPSFNCALRCMLKFITVYDGNLEEDYIVEMIREFSKICELLPEHKEVFKKHLMFLVIDHIDILTNSDIVQSKRKKLLEPIIILLVDCLTVYENQQLASMIPLSGKPFLQSILKNFQEHQYKGQF